MGSFYEKRQFAPAPAEDDYHFLAAGRRPVPFGAGQIFTCENLPELVLGFEICEDLWAPDAPSVHMAQAGATIIGNLSASNEVLGKADYRRQLVSMQSAKLLCGYVYASAGEGESTSDVVFGGHQMIAENGALLGEKRFEHGLLISEIDVQKLRCERRRTQVFSEIVERKNYKGFTLTVSDTKLTRYVAPMPFVPEGKEAPGRAVPGDSSHRLPGLKAEAAAHRGQDRCGGALRRTGLHAGGAGDGPCHENAGPAHDGHHCRHDALLWHHGPDQEQCRDPGGADGGGAENRGYLASVRSHFKDIGHDMDDHSVTFENAQARERTQVLMDIANRSGGLVIGTGDLSELALGCARITATI